jgi:predicted membrane protein
MQNNPISRVFVKILAIVAIDVVVHFHIYPDFHFVTSLALRHWSHFIDVARLQPLKNSLNTGQ